MIHAIVWKDSGLEVLDQRWLPEKVVYRHLTTIQEIYHAIQSMMVRGAPLIGITAAYGLYLGMKNQEFRSRPEFDEQLQRNVEYLKSARPTAVNLAWALDWIWQSINSEADTSLNKLTEDILQFAKKLHEDDRQRCEAIGRWGAQLLPQNAVVLTHCNTGALATGGIGTALGVIYTAFQQGNSVFVFVDETRPFLQGARLTAWELQQAKIPVTLICDDMAAWLMRKKKIDAVIVGADRITQDGSVANKIGTYGLAILANYHNVPFYVAAPLSSFDMQLTSGDQIPIEERSCEEVRKIFHKYPIAPADVPCWNPAFDVTPANLITAIITEKGVIESPNLQSVQAFLHENITIT